MSNHTRRQSLGSRQEHLRADVCVIGAGIAGLIAATRIAARSQLQVIVLESGTSTILDHQDPMTSLDTVLNPDGVYQGIARGRGVGGTSAKWAGKLLPLSPHDIAARPYLGLDAWPIDPETLSQHTRDIETMMEVDTGSYEHDLDKELDPHGQLPTHMEEIVWRWPKRPSKANHRIDHVLRAELDRLPNLTIWTDATVAALSVETGRLAYVRARNHRGGDLLIEANNFVIAAGTLESTRLLLMTDEQNDGCISRTTDSLGRYFNDHFGLEVAGFHSPSMGSINRVLADRKVGKTVRHLHGELSKARQQSEGIGSAYFDFDATFPNDSAISQARAAIASLRERHIGETLRHFGGIARDPRTVINMLAWRARHRQQFWPDDAEVKVKIWIEQLPIAANRLRLADKRDSLGVPMLRVDLTKTSTDEHTLRAAMDSFKRCWHSISPSTSLEWIPTAQRSVDSASEQAHPAGSTRMGHDLRHSVVNSALRVHAIDNVQIASASVFPSSGSANPTLTIMQLAMVVADDILRRFGTTAP